MELALQALLSGICVNSYPTLAPSEAQAPYVVWQQVGGREVTALTKKRVKRNALVQISVWATTPDEATSVLAQIDAALRSSTAFQASPSGTKRMTYEHETSLYGEQQDWSIWP
ncbi:DUF3168 domain-containing protein [Comamonas sp.]|uniref:tail completion protein gp17 n=1 Tax=Comamonas sp. TaxID=34028 RepID=UPI00258DE0AD|nr:DUF3168 domain-containing protein [Comamonas sp.]